MNTKRWIALAIVAGIVLGSLVLIKLFPFWTTLACLVSLIAGFAAGYMFKNPEKTTAEIVDADSIVEKFKDWFSGLTSNEVTRAVVAAKKAKVIADKKK